MGTDDQQQTPPADEHAAQPVNAHDLERVVSSQPDEQALALFEAQANERIRKVFVDGRWWYSVIDTIALLTGSASPRNYWAVVKHRLLEEGAHQTLTNCKQRLRRLPCVDAG